MIKLTIPSVSRDLLDKLHARSPDRQEKMWGNNVGRPAQFKQTITTLLEVIQSKRCAYCGAKLFGSQHHRDHIAPKHIHKEWTFYPQNLVLACYHCNSERKGELDTVLLKGPTYESTTFIIVHPYLDNPPQHLQYIGYRSHILVQAVNSSDKGRETIKMFDLDSPEKSKARAKDVLFDNDLAHLHGKWRLLFEQVVFSPVSKNLVLKLRQ